MEIKTLKRGDDEAIVEAGSQAEAELRAIGFSDEVQVPAAPKPAPKGKK